MLIFEGVVIPFHFRGPFRVLGVVCGNCVGWSLGAELFGHADRPVVR